MIVLKKIRKKTSAYFLYRIIFYLSDHYLPACSDTCRLLYYKSTSMPSLQHMFSGNLPVPGCRVCPALQCMSCLAASQKHWPWLRAVCVRIVTSVLTRGRGGRADKFLSTPDFMGFRERGEIY